MVQSAFAISNEEQSRAFSELEIAKSEIQSVRNLLPAFLRKTIGKNLENAEQRISYAQNILGTVEHESKYYCTIESSFKGTFGGEGSTELGAKQEAMSKCLNVSKAMFCKQDSYACEKNNP
jgi:hypothetical protein